MVAIPWQPKEYAYLGGGMNTSAASTYVGEGEFVTLENVELSTDGALRIRKGYKDVAVAESTHLIGTGLFTRQPLTGSDELLKTCKNAGAFKSAALKKRSTSTWTTISPTAFTLADHKYIQPVQYNNVVYLFAFGGTNSVMKCDGTNFTELAGAPDAQMGVLYYDRIWAAGDPTAPSTLYFTSAGDPDDYATGTSGTISVAEGDGDVITGLGVLFNRLLVFKTDSIYAVDGNDLASFSIQKVTGDIGLVGALTAVPVENRVVYQSRRCWARTDGSTTVNISEKIGPTRSSFSSTLEDRSCGLQLVGQNQVMFLVATDGASALNRVMLYTYSSSINEAITSTNLPVDGWTLYTPFPFAAMALFSQKVYFLGATDGKLYIFLKDESDVVISTDNGTPVTAVIKSRWMDHDAPHLTKFWRRITFVFETSGTVSSYNYVALLGVPASSHLRFKIVLVSGVATITFYTDFDETTVDQTLSATVPSNDIIGLQSYIIDAQVVGDRVPRL